jgi:hypothetical protein
MQPKLTLKYIGAVMAAETVIDADLIPRLNQNELYYALGTRGFRWDGSEWRRETTPVQGPDTLIRVMGDIDAANEATLDICAALVAKGYKIVAKSEPHKNANGREIRRYLTVAKEK